MTQERDSIATRNKNCRAFARGDSEELVFEGQLIAWRVDGEAYMMLGDTDARGVVGELNYMLSCRAEGGQVDNRRFFWTKGGYQYTSGADRDVPTLGPNEVIRVST